MNTERSRSERGRPRSFRSLAARAGGLGAAFVIASSCSAPFDPPGKLNSVRIVSVDPSIARTDGTVSGSYARPGETVHFKMNVTDSLDPASMRPLQIVWLGGCYDPEGDQYFGCYAQLADLLGQLSSGAPPPPGTFAAGIGLDTFDLPIPDDIVTRRPRPPTGAYAGTAFVFFVACAGNVRPIPPSGTSNAGSFPLGCFDADGKQLGSDSFVAGYTEVFAFEDERDNPSPTMTSLDLADQPMPEDFGAAPHVSACAVSDVQRKQAGCASTDPFAECTTYKLKAVTAHDVADVDPEAESAEHTQLHETVWASYFADGGDFDFDTKLVSDAQEGYKDTQEVTWVPPEEPGTYTIWAVLHDSRGGSSTVERFVIVDPAP